MRKAAIAGSLVIALMLLAPALATAQTRSDVYNGATCISYPPYDTTVAIPFSYFLYGFREGANCHITMPDGWRVSELSYVLFQGRVSAGSDPVRVRLCVYQAGAAAVCGAERTLTTSTSVNWVVPPATIPTYASGAYLVVRFPPGHVTLFDQFIPVWSR